jgi:hypothetical protein
MGNGDGYIAKFRAREEALPDRSEGRDSARSRGASTARSTQSGWSAGGFGAYRGEWSEGGSSSEEDGGDGDGRRGSRMSGSGFRAREGGGQPRDPREREARPEDGPGPPERAPSRRSRRTPRFEDPFDLVREDGDDDDDASVAWRRVALGSRGSDAGSMTGSAAGPSGRGRSSLPPIAGGPSGSIRAGVERRRPVSPASTAVEAARWNISDHKTATFLRAYAAPSLSNYSTKGREVSFFGRETVKRRPRKGSPKRRKGEGGKELFRGGLGRALELGGSSKKVPRGSRDGGSRSAPRRLEPLDAGGGSDYQPL